MRHLATLAAGCLVFLGLAAATPVNAYATPSSEPTGSFQLENGLEVVFREKPGETRVGWQFEHRRNTHGDSTDEDPVAWLLATYLASPRTANLGGGERDALFAGLGAEPYAPRARVVDGAVGLVGDAPASQFPLTLFALSEALAHGADGAGATDWLALCESHKREWHSGGTDLPAVLFASVWNQRPTRPLFTENPDWCIHALMPKSILRARLISDFGMDGARLLVAGGVRGAELEPLVRRYFGGLPRGEKPTWKPPPSAPLQAERRQDVRLPTPAPFVVLAWPTVRYLTPDDGALDVIATLLKTRLEERIVRSGGLSGARVVQASTLQGSVFFVEAGLAAGQSVDAGVAQLDQELERLRAGDFSDEELRAARDLREARLLVSEGVEEEVNWLSTCREVGNPRCLTDHLERIRTLDRAAVLRVLGAQLPPLRRLVFVARKDAPPTARHAESALYLEAPDTSPAPLVLGDAVASSALWDKPPLLGPMLPVPWPTVDEGRGPQGVLVRAVVVPEAAIDRFRVFIPLGPGAQVTWAEAEVLADLWGDAVLPDGTSVAVALSRQGISFEWATIRDRGLALSFSCKHERFEQGVHLALSSLLQGRTTEGALEAVRAYADAKRNRPAPPLEPLHERLFPTARRGRHLRRAADTAGITAARLDALAQALFTPGKLTVTTVGKATRAELERAVARVPWPTGAQRPKAAPAGDAVVTTAKPGVWLVPTLGPTRWVVGAFSPGRGQTPRNEVLVEVLRRALAEVTSPPGPLTGSLDGGVASWPEGDFLWVTGVAAPGGGPAGLAAALGGVQSLLGGGQSRGSLRAWMLPAQAALARSVTSPSALADRLAWGSFDGTTAAEQGKEIQLALSMGPAELGPFARERLSRGRLHVLVTGPVVEGEVAAYEALGAGPVRWSPGTEGGVP